MRVYLDDERATPSGWVRTFTASETIEVLNSRKVSELSLDHDLGLDPKVGNGYDVLLWLEETIFTDSTFPIPEINIHSANPAARVRMSLAVESIKRIAQERLNHSQ